MHEVKTAKQVLEAVGLLGQHCPSVVERFNEMATRTGGEWCWKELADGRYLQHRAITQLLAAKPDALKPVAQALLNGK